MPSDRPTVPEILQAIDQFLQDKVSPQLEPHSRFHLKVTHHLLQLLQREWAQGDALERTELERLQQLLKNPNPDLDALNRDLCDAIRTGKLSLDDPGLKEHLRRTARDKLAIDNPRYQSGP